MKIILINPPARFVQYDSIVLPPLGLMYVGAALKNAGFNIKIKDAFAEKMNWHQFQDYIRKEKPDIMGINGMSPVIDTSFKAIKIARPYTGHITMGGPHITLFKQKIFDQCPEIDSGITGEGEETAVQLFRALDGGSPIDGINGVITRDTRNAERRLAADINDIAYPEKHGNPDIV